MKFISILWSSLALSTTLRLKAVAAVDRSLRRRYWHFLKVNMASLWWRKYSGLVLCKSRGNSGVTASTSRHWKLQESSLWRWFHTAGKCHTRHGVALPRCGGGLGLGLVLLVVGFSWAGKYTDLLISSLGMSGAALSTRLMGALRLRRSCSWLGERKGSWLVV